MRELEIVFSAEKRKISFQPTYSQSLHLKEWTHSWTPLTCVRGGESTGTRLCPLGSCTSWRGAFTFVLQADRSEEAGDRSEEAGDEHPASFKETSSALLVACRPQGTPAFHGRLWLGQFQGLLSFSLPMWRCSGQGPQCSSTLVLGIPCVSLEGISLNVVWLDHL